MTGGRSNLASVAPRVTAGYPTFKAANFSIFSVRGPMKGRADSPTRARLIGRKAPAMVTPRRAAPKPPPGLPAGAKRVWLRDVAHVAGGLREADAGSFEMCCRLSAVAEEALAGLETKPETAPLALRLVRGAMDLRRRFGLSPVDRQRIHAEPEREEDELERFRRENPRA
jgi:phage terminase small subunit